MNLKIAQVIYTDSVNEKHTYYKIKKKFLFWYFDYEFKVFNDLYNCCITYKKCQKFNKHSDASQAIAFLHRKDKVIKYRGRRIEMIIQDVPNFHWAYVITNKPLKEDTQRTYHQFSKHIDGLKARIDRALTTEKVVEKIMD